MLKPAVPVARRDPRGGTLQINAALQMPGGHAPVAQFTFIRECLALDGVKWPGVLRYASNSLDVDCDLMRVHTKRGTACTMLLLGR